MPKKIIAHLLAVKLSKRKEFVLITAVLTTGLFATQLISGEYRYWGLLVLTLLSCILSAIALRENLTRYKWLMLIILPTLFTAAVGLFYFLLPVRWLTRLPIGILYAVGIYAILLVENIYSVAVNRTIQLLRVAHAVGFLISLVTGFLLLNTMFSLRFASYYNMLIVFVISFPIILQSLWSIQLEDRIIRVVFIYTLGISWILAQLGFVISFWPLKPIIISIFMTTVTYALLGISHQYLMKRLYRKNIVEYVQVVAIVTIMILLTTRYR